MDTTFFDYLQQLEMMAFFSGYPLIYALVIFIFGNKQSKSGIGSKMISFLPFAYALVGTLFLGLQIRNLYPDYSFENIQLLMQQSYLKFWAFFSLLFWIPAIAKKSVLSLLHSLVFFFFLARDLLLHIFQTTSDKTIIRNDMKIYSDSLILNLVALVVITVIYYSLIRLKPNKNSSSS